MKGILYKKIIFLLTILIILNIGALLVTYMLSRNIISNKQKLIMVYSASVFEDERRVQAEILRQGLDRTEDERSSIENVFLSAEGVTSFLDEIEVLAEKGNLSGDFRSVDINEEDKSFTFEMSILGKRNEVFKFIHLLELLPYSLKLEEVRIGVSDEASNDWSGVLVFRILSDNSL